MPFTLSNLAAGMACLSVLGCSPVPDREARQEPPLANTVWVLAELAGHSVTVPPNMRLVDLRFQPRSRFTGFTGCNVLAGRYEATDTRLEFREPLTTTLGICPAPVIREQEG